MPLRAKTIAENEKVWKMYILLCNQLCVTIAQLWAALLKESIPRTQINHQCFSMSTQQSSMLLIESFLCLLISDLLPIIINVSMINMRAASCSLGNLILILECGWPYQKDSFVSIAISVLPNLACKLECQMLEYDAKHVNLSISP